MSETRPSRHLSSLQWFGWALPAGFLVSFFVAPIFAVTFTLSLGAVAAAFHARWRRHAAPLWLAAPAPAVFALMAGSFVHGFSRHPAMHVWPRIAEGIGETVAIMMANGHLPLEGATPLAPWWHVTAVWALSSGTAALLGSIASGRRARISSHEG